MELLKRYSISFGIAGLFLYFFIVWVEERNESNMPHNLSTKKEEKVSVTLVPKRYHEKCVDLNTNQKLQYGFNSDALLKFNLHYHDEGEKIFIVQEDSSNNLEKIFKPQKRAYYCLMWVNSGEKNKKIDYYFKIIN